jgi:hypothetical protein
MNLSYTTCTPWQRCIFQQIDRGSSQFYWFFIKSFKSVSIKQSLQIKLLLCISFSTRMDSCLSALQLYAKQSVNGFCQCSPWAKPYYIVSKLSDNSSTSIHACLITNNFFKQKHSKQQFQWLDTKRIQLHSRSNVCSKSYFTFLWKWSLLGSNYLL